MPKKIPESEIERLRAVGFDTSGKLPRSGSFMVSDSDVVESEGREKKLEIMPIARALEIYPWVEKYLFKAVPEDRDDFTKLVAEHPLVGHFIRVHEGAKVRVPLQSCFFIKTARFSQILHNIIIVEPGAELHIITGCATASYVLNGKHISASEFYVKEGGVLTYTMVHSWAKEVEVYPRTGVFVDKDAIFVSNYVALTPAKIVQSYPIARVKKGGFAGFYSIVYSQPDSLYDLGAAVHLLESGAKAEIVSRVVSNGGGAISRGYILGAAKDTTGHMECSGILLSERGFIHAIPELKGAIPDTELSHEAAVGRIAPEEISYLMARGLDEETAKALIIRGFLDIKVKYLPDELQKSIDEMIEMATKGTAI